ncbi:MAG: TolC family protein [Prevotellaceae bacterium]|nr:TolC family protein [Prevotellaceae bacterium]
MNRLLCSLSLLIGALVAANAQQLPVSLDSCRALAIANNKEVLISQEKINAARYERKAAFTRYLPTIAATGGYLRTGRELSLLNGDQKSALGSLGTQVSGAMQQGIASILAQNPSLMQDPQLMALLQALGGIDMATPLNDMGQSLVDAFRTDTRNLFGGALTLTQPLYMGGKIRAYNKITQYAEELARQQHNGALQDVILSTDQAYWQVVSLAGKRRLAESYLTLLQKLESDIDKMIAEGVATRADGLSVKVKVNEAEMTLTKVDDGLSLARMLLCQLCGVDLSKPMTLADEAADSLAPTAAAEGSIDMNSVYDARSEVRSLELATQIYRQKVNVARADYLPSLALIGSYAMTNPSVFNSFERKLKGTWNVGVVLNVPLWNWGEGVYKVKAARAEARIAQHQLDDAKEKITLQVSQSLFKVNEAAKKLRMAEKNLEKANENLNSATLGFEEGVIPASNVLEAHTAWLSAQSERIDAQIDVKLADVYLRKATGELQIEN